LPQAKAVAPSEKELLSKAQNGDEEAVRGFLALADERGITQRVLERFHVDRQAHLSVVESFSKDNLLAAVVNDRRIDQMRAELAGPCPSPLERRLIDRIILCWFNVNLIEITLAQCGAEMTLARHDHHQKRLSSAHKRFLQAIKALAQVHKLQLSAVQTNVAEKQVNIAQANGNTSSQNYLYVINYMKITWSRSAAAKD